MVDEKRKKSDELTFGVGCVNLMYRGDPPYTLKGAEYRKAVEEALQGIKSVNHVRVTRRGDDHGEIRIAKQPAGLREGRVPLFSGTQIEFEIYIPGRVQKEIAAGVRLNEIGTDRFKVFIDHEYDSPVCFVVPIESSTSDPSYAIKIVREYLRRELNKPESKIWMDFLGPSPFHANFFVAPREKVENKIDVELHEQRGYDQIRIWYDASRYADALTAFDVVRHMLGDELSVFYYIAQHRSRQAKAWREIESYIAEARTSTAKASPLTKLRSAMTRGALLARLHSALVDFEANDVTSKQLLAKRAAGTYKGSLEFIRPYVDAKLRHAEAYPVSQVGRLVSFLSERRSKNAEMVIVLIAAIVGGAVGSAVTALAQPNAPSASPSVVAPRVAASPQANHAAKQSAQEKVEKP